MTIKAVGSLTASQVKRLNDLNEIYKVDLAADLPIYPEEGFEEFRLLLQEDGGLMTSLGWKSHNLFARAEDFDFGEFSDEHRHQKRKGRRQVQRSGKGKGNGQSGGKSLLNPEIVRKVVEARIQASGLEPVGMTGKVKRAVWNLEFLTEAKANWFMTSYELIIPLAHIWSCCEVSQDGMRRIAERTGYKAYTSQDNSRGSQAVSVLIHPRFKVTEEWTVNEVRDVQGVNDLRPLHGVNIEDTAESDPEQQRSWAAVHHAKSMRGGVATTSKIRYQQNKIIAEYLRDKGRGGLGGDFNTVIGTPAGDIDIAPLLAAGFALVDPGDKRATQIQGSRLDALFTLEEDLRIEELLDWFNDPVIGRSLTDHGSVVFV